jgi:transcriptional regulator with XRE-family HTH domain
MPRVSKKAFPPLTNSSETIGQRIARYRKTQGLTQQQLADSIGIDQNLVSDYERGMIRLYDEMVGRFALALNVSADELLGLKANSELPDVSLRIARRFQEIEKLPDTKRKHVLRAIDDLLKANTSADPPSGSQ